MHGRFESPAKSDSRATQQAAIKYLFFPVLVVIALTALIVVQPNAASWIAEAVQAEFVGDVPSVPPPTQFVQPSAEPHSITSEGTARDQTAWRAQR